MMRLAVAGFLFGTAALLAGCSSTATLDKLAASNAQESWQQLRRIDAATPVVESYSKLRFEAPRRQTVNARTAIDRQGRFRAELLTPLGTTAATLFADEQGVVFINDLQTTYWRGTHAELAAVSPSLAALVRLGSASGRLLYGLPAAAAKAADQCSSDGSECMAGAFRHEVAPSGIRRATAGEVVFTFEPPAFPAERLTVEVGAQRLTVEHLELQTRDGAVRAPTILPNYRCCVAPSIDARGDE